MMQKTQQTLPIIPWMGGKRRLAKHLLPMFPEHSCYVELFSGGAALFFMRPTPAKVEVLNDINGQLINLYRVVQHHFDEFVRQFDWSQYELLAKAMAESNGKFMLSINDHPDIRELFKDFRITQLELAYTVGRDKTGKTSGELVICNW